MAQTLRGSKEPYVSNQGIYVTHNPVVRAFADVNPQPLLFRHKLT